MTRLTGVRAPEDVTTRKRPHSPAWSRSRAEVLADPRVRLAAGAAAALVSALAVHRNRVGAAEAMAFRAVSGLPDSLYLPAWAVIIALQGTFLGLVVGVFFGWALVLAQRNQGITVFSVPYARLLIVIVLAGLAGVAAAILPSRRAAKLNILQAIVTE